MPLSGNKLEMQTETVDEIIKRLQSHRGIVAVIVSKKDGVIIRSTVDSTSSAVYMGWSLVIEERGSKLVRDADPDNSLVAFRLRTNKFEIIFTTGIDYNVVVVQNIQSENKTKESNKKRISIRDK